jgi:dTDP-4-dehydrorhamnose reductase
VTRRLFVTGATGYLGRELVRRARAAGWEVEETRVDVRDAELVAAHVARTRPDAVVHTAYRHDPPDTWTTNVEGSEHVARAAATAGIRLVHLSTDVVFDGRLARPYREDDEPSPCTDYGHSKAEAELRVTAEDPDALLVRASLIYGGPGHEPSKHELVALDPNASFYTDEIRSPVQVGDLAAALLELVETDLAGPLHVAGADDVSRAEFAELAAGRPVTRVPAPPGRPLNCALDSSRARAFLTTPLRGVSAVLGR